jgi:hypothetical protein
MIDLIVKLIFKWDNLRQAVTSEVHMYDSIGRRLDEGTGAKFWSEQDGWRGWEYNESRNKYYFTDIPEPDLIAVFQSIEEMEAWQN